MLCRIEGRKINNWRVTSCISLLTFHSHLHMVDKTMDDHENPRCNRPSLIQSELIQPEPFQHHLNVLPSRMLLCEYLCVALSQVRRQRGGTHLVVLA